MKFYYFLIPAMILLHQTAVGQVTTEQAPRAFAEEMPIYPGGNEGMNRDISMNAPYPEEEFKKKIEGKVYVQFVVETDGSVSNVKVIRGVAEGPGLDEAALNAVKKLKNFTPGKQDGVPVRITMTVPINFTVPRKKSK